jgi:hypothetical protein
MKPQIIQDHSRKNRDPRGGVRAKSGHDRLWSVWDENDAESNLVVAYETARVCGLWQLGRSFPPASPLPFAPLAAACRGENRSRSRKLACLPLVARRLAHGSPLLSGSWDRHHRIYLTLDI